MPCHGVRHWLDLLRGERAWLVGTVERLRAGDFDLAGEPWRWVPAADDPGRQMQVDRERYRRAAGPSESADVARPDRRRPLGVVRRPVSVVVGECGCTRAGETAHWCSSLNTEGRGPMIRARGLVQTFQTRVGKEKKEVRAVDGVDLDVAEGEVVGFLGPNGAGKTTTLRMLTTLLRPDAGTATVAGYDVVRESVQVRRSIGYVSQAGGVSSGAAPARR